ncbi:TPA: ATP-binding protein [Pseudomonas aeruginosa 0C2E]|uniref:Phosphonate ABC transporter permease n=1 Tax=Solimonas fluminis TaxID=2086571 RepID=A0A2S5TGL5_9GAMM|nr:MULTISPECIES: ATP-binding protein [Gammaproteobacteria]MBY8967176.1 ATP-binding protein [Algiphilus acroporae]EWH27889.1 phosphonate ABC transporter permease [Pseudomonas aeruginosa SG17M]KUI88870.1 phosphonate ABC transporter permease [Pseudomonas aeruginosa 0C2E]MBF3175132.1 ATP-binding protein [Pseudomonas aeruginosa]PPE73988.1 phosphonate ABC transporter permease [Solimonas fluminis]
MSRAHLRFQVDSRLATLLSQEYSSSERALKELVDNAWDADAERVAIALPKPLSGDPIVIQDDGTGMTEEELRRHYLSIASDRRSRRGDRTSGKNRLVKGRKGIGKFAGLMAAAVMTLETRARGRLCRITLRLDDLSQVEDIEQLNIGLQSEPCGPELHGTTITLSDLHQGLAYPDANRLRQILLQDYGRQDDFAITIDGKRLDVDDVSGSYSEQEEELPSAGKVKLRFSISDGKSGLRQPGITLRVDGKAVGRPGFFGLDQRDDFPSKLLRKLYGEIEADGLRDHITAGWDAAVENSELLKEVEGYVQPILREAYEQQYRREIQLAQARLQRAILTRLSALPEHKRVFADRAIKKILDKYYGEPESKVEPVVNVLLEAMERSDYRILLEHIAEATPGDVAGVAERLDEFGLAEMAFLVQQATARQVFLDQLDALARDAATTEAVLHKALERNLWVFGPEYSLFSSNSTLRRQVGDVLGKTYTGDKADKRPDLLLNENLGGQYLLIEFKRPSHALNHDDYVQAIGYRHELAKYLGSPIQVLLVGGSRSPDFPTDNREPHVEARIFGQVISTARRQIEWLLRTAETCSN